MEIILSLISCICIVLVFLTKVKNDFWLFKVLEYPRIQKLILFFPILTAWALYWPPDTIFQWVSFAGLALSLLYLLYKIIPYTVLNRREMKNVPPGDPAHTLRIFTANVLQTNREYDRLIKQIRSVNPDIIFLLETDQLWANATQHLDEDYPYQLKEPLDNTYGLLFFSRLPMDKGRVNYLVKDDIPSVEATVRLPSGQAVKVWGLHPEPPVPNESLYATAKDKELMKVAIAARECKTPCVVMGDLNDVAWSHTTELFRKTSELLDPRRGRGFYSTFSAHHWFMRFPLDYIFCSPDFGLVSMKKMPKNGSDHFAICIHLVHKPALEKEQPTAKADHEEIMEAREKATTPIEPEKL